MAGQRLSLFLAAQLILMNDALVRTSPSGTAVCHSNSCQRFSKLLRKNVNTDADPCQDFYEYACGEWIANNPVPSGAESLSQAVISNEIILGQILEFLREDVDVYKDNDAEKWAKQQYRACTNEDELNEKGIYDLLAITDEAGGWPMIRESKVAAEKHWLDVHQFYNRITGEGSLFSIRVLLNDTASTSHALCLDQPRTMFKYSSPRNADDHVNFMTDVALEFSRAKGTGVTRETLVKDARRVHEFRKRIERLRQRFPFRKIGAAVTIAALQKSIDSRPNNVKIDWLEIMRRVWSDAKSDVVINKEEIIRFREPEYIRQLLSLLYHTSEQTILNHIHFHFVERHIQHTTTEMRKLLSSLRGIDAMQDWAKICAANKNLQKVINRVYIKRYFPESAKDAAERLVSNIKNTLREEISRSEWLGKQTIKYALHKLKNVAVIIGYDDSYKSDNDTIAYYNKYNAGPDYLRNILKYETTKYKDELALLRRPVPDIRKISELPPITFDAVYSLLSNKLEIPAAYLQFPIFNESLPNVVNYATVGSLVGNKLSHAFDFFGRRIDGWGSYKNGWENNATTEYDNRIQCFIDQYSGNTGRKIDQNQLKDVFSGGLTRLYVDSIPDAEGLITAYETYAKLNKLSGGANRSLPSVDDYGNDQIFFLAYASRNCHSFAPDALASINEEDVPLTPRIMVNSAVSNMQQFSDAFHCKPGAFMNPFVKCKVWG